MQICSAPYNTYFILFAIHHLLLYAMHSALNLIHFHRYLFSDFLCPKADVPITPNHLPRDDSQYEQLYVNDNPQPSQNQHSVSHRQLQPQCEGQEEVFQPQRTMMTSHENEPSSLTDMRASMKSGKESFANSQNCFVNDSAFISWLLKCVMCPILIRCSKLVECSVVIRRFPPFISISL